MSLMSDHRAWGARAAGGGAPRSGQQLRAFPRQDPAAVRASPWRSGPRRAAPGAPGVLGSRPGLRQSWPSLEDGGEVPARKARPLRLCWGGAGPQEGPRSRWGGTAPALGGRCPLSSRLSRLCAQVTSASLSVHFLCVPHARCHMTRVSVRVSWSSPQRKPYPLSSQSLPRPLPPPGTPPGTPSGARNLTAF